MSPSPLTISLLGPFEVTVHGQPMRRLRSRSLEWLLALLVLRQGRPLSRAVLAGTLWPESGHDLALRNLRTGLLDLRRALGPEASRLGSPTRDSLQLDLTGAAVDLLRFDAAITVGDEGSLQDAVALYRGDLLEGCHEEWIVGERAARQEACLQALERLADLALEGGEAPTALGHLHRAEALDPLRDSVQQRRMRALAENGDLPAALLSYREYRLRLHREMNLEPDPETTRLFRDLQAGRGVHRGERTPEIRGEPAAPEAGPAESALSPSSAAFRFPRPLTTLIGREAEAAEVTSLVSSARLVTLIGGGGVGKTRLVLQVAAGLEARYPGRVLFVELAPLADPALLPAFVAAALGLHEEARPVAGLPIQTLIDWLSREPALLVLDNCEHLIEAAAELVQSLLAACPELRLLATSRQRLGVSGEIAWRVPSLPAPDPAALPPDAAEAVAQVLQFPAAQLLVERAAVARPGFRLRSGEDARAVARICQRLDGIPLALELAAARVTVLNVSQIASRLDDRFQLLTGGNRAAMPRHQTLRALIDWSYDGLPEAEAALLRRLSVFAGGWTLEAAEAVAGGELGESSVLDLLASLESRSLVIVEEMTAGLRYRMLETVREYAREKLQACGEEAAARAQHMAYFLALAETAAAAMRGPRQLEWLNVLEAEHDNLRAALAWSLEAPGDGEAGLRLATAVEVLWSSRHYLDEGRRYLDAVLSSPLAAGRTAVRAAALQAAGSLSYSQSDFAAARSWAEECLAICEELGDQIRIARSLYLLSALASDEEEARRLATRSLALFRECHYPSGIAAALTRLSSFASAAQEYDTARALHREALTVVRSIGDRSLEAGCLSGLATIEYDRRDYAAARDCFQASLALARELGMHNQTAVSLYFLGRIAFQEGDHPAARAYWEECREVDRRNRTKGGAVLGALAELGARQGDYEMARARWEESLAAGRELGRGDLVACAQRGLGDVARLEGDSPAALSWYVESLQTAQGMAARLETRITGERHEAECAACLRGIATILSRFRREEQAVRLLGAAEMLAEAVGATVPAAAQSDYQEQVAALRESLGVEPFAAAWADGRAMSLGEAVECAAGSELLAGGMTEQPGERAAGRQGEPEKPEAVPVPTRTAPCVAHSPPPTGAPSRLPRSLTALIGRETEVAEVAGLVSSARLVTLTGGGGVGKTRLALQVAAGLEARYPGRVLFVELAPLADPALLPAFVAAALGLHEASGSQSQHLQQALADWLSREPALLVLDNCEHLIEAAAALVQSLLQACPELRLLATSRQRLGVTGEVAWRVPSLPAPDPEGLPAAAPGTVEQVLQFPATRLFVERAAMARPGFRIRSGDEALAVARICQRLDGIPLALELAAARVTVLNVSQIASRLDDRFQLLTGGNRAAMPRHQTLRALIDWSYDGLPEAEAALLRRLSVFAGGWTLEAAEAVCSGVQVFRCSGLQGEPVPSPEHLNTRTPEHLILDLLDSLEGRSLVLAEEFEEGLRYRMLETVRAYAREKLRKCGEEASAGSAHAAYLLSLAETASAAMHGPEQLQWLNVLEAEHDNLRAALEWTQVDAPERFLRLAAALWPFWEARGYLSEGRQHLRAALQQPRLPDTPERAQVLLGAARLALHQGDLDEADTFAQEGRERFRSWGDTRGMAAALLCLGEAAFARGQFAAARSLFAEGLEACRQSGWTQGSARALVKLGAVALMLGELPQAQSPLEEGLVLAETLGDAPTLALALYERGCLAMREDDDARAAALLEQSVDIWHRLGHKQTTAEALGALGRLAGRQGDPTRAISCLQQAAATYRELGARMDLAWTLQEAGNVQYAAGFYAQARAAYEESLAIFRGLNDRHGIACADNNLGMACFRLGDPAAAQALHLEALAIYQSRDHGEGMTWSLERLGMAEARLGDAVRAARMLGAAGAAREGLGVPVARLDQEEWDQAVAALRARLTTAPFEDAWAEGRAMSLDQAVEFASSSAR